MRNVRGVLEAEAATKDPGCFALNKIADVGVHYVYVAVAHCMISNRYVKLLLRYGQFVVACDVHFPSDTLSL